MTARAAKESVTPGVFNALVESGPTGGAVRFADVARRLAAATRAAGLVVPAFRAPPRRPGATRTLRRLPGGPVVAVRVRGRAPSDVLADMVEGVIVANALGAEAAANVRVALLVAVTQSPRHICAA